MTSSSPSSTRKSQRLENRTAISPPPKRKSVRLVTSPPQSEIPGPPPATRKSEKSVALPPKSPPVTRKLERLVKGDSLSPLRRSERGKLGSSSTPSGSKLVEEGSGLLKAKKKKEKKEKSIQMLTMMKATEVISAEYDEEPIPICPKRRLDGHSYKASFKPQRRRTREPDSEEELRIKEALQRTDQTGGAVNSSEILGDKENLGDEICSGVAEGSRKDIPEERRGHDLSEKPHGTSVEGNVESLEISNGHKDRREHDLSEKPHGTSVEGNVESLEISNGHKDMREHDLSEKPHGTSVEGNVESLEISNGHKDYSNMQNMESPDLVTPSISPDTDKHDFITTCFLCSKKRRLVYDSPEEELCSCTNARNGDCGDTSEVKSSKTPLVKLQRLPEGGLSTTGDNLLSNVNKLREFWHKNQNAVIIDETERMINVIYFIFSLSDVHKPFLIIATFDILAQWEAVFTRLKPSVHVVVYNADRGCMESIRSVEFHGEQGGKLLQVLLCPIDVAIKGFQILKHLKWEIIILDECQSSVPLKMLDAEMRMILLRSPLKDLRDDYLRVLSFLDSSGDLGGEADYLKYDKADSLVKLRDCFSKFIAYDCSFDTSKFVEYWLPAPISNLQLEQYCLTLLSGLSTLTSTNMKNNIVGEKIHEILLTVRKCCDHPYVVDRDVLVSRISQGYPSSDNVDFGMKASGKLHLLYKMLSEIKGQKLRALVLFQSFDGAKESIGDMLEDLMRDRFGQDSYERIEHCVGHNKKQAALNRFGKEDSKQFVFLLENRACHSRIKLSVDIVVVFSSEWAPANDIRTLQRISITTREKVPIFRLYSSFTVEEKALILGKQVPNLDITLQNVNRGPMGNTLLMWGASSLFSRLEDYHTSNSSASVKDVSFGHALLDDVVKDFLTILLDTGTSDSQRGSNISKAFRRDGIYHTDCPLFGEGEVQLTVGEESRLFWNKLLEGRYPRWKFSHVQTQRNRKRVSYAEGSSRKSEMLNDEAGKKRRKDHSVHAVGPHQPDIEEGEIGGSDEDALIAGATSQFQSLAGSQSANALNSLSDGKSSSRQNSMCQPKTRSPSIEQQSLHVFLKAEIAKLCKALKLSEDVEHTVQRILEYLMKTRHVNEDNPHLLQAFQMSLCWIAADILGQHMDRKAFFLEARKMLNFGCPDELVDSVYQKLMPMKETFEQLPAKIADSVLRGNVVSPVSDNAVCPSTSKEPHVKAEVEYISSLNPDLEQDQEPKEKTAVTVNEKNLRKIQKYCKKRKLKTCQKHEQEMKEFEKIWKEKREKLEEEHEIELAVVSSIHSGATKMDRLRAARIKFSMLVEDHERSKEVEHKLLKKKHEAEIEMENRKCEKWLAEAVIRSGLSKIGNDVTLESESSDGTPTTQRVSGNSLPTTAASDAVLSDVPVNVENEVVDHGFPMEEEPQIEQVEILTSAEQPEAAAVSSQNGKDFTILEAPIDSDQIGNDVTLESESSDGTPTTQRISGNSLPTTAASDAVLSDVPVNVENEVVDHGYPVEEEPQIEQVEILTSAEQPEAAAVSSQNGKDFTILEAPIDSDQIHNEIPSANINNASDSELLDNGAPDMETGCVDANVRNDEGNSIIPNNNPSSGVNPSGDRSVHRTISSDVINSADSPTPVVSPQVVESTAELHEQVAPVVATGLQPSTEVIDSVGSHGVPDLSTTGGTGHEPISELFVSSHNPAPLPVSGNAVEPQHNVVSQSGCNLTTREAVFCTNPDLPAASGINHEPNGEQPFASQNPYQAVSQPGRNLAGVHGTRFPSMPHPRTALSAHAPLAVEPLQSELEKIDKEREQVIKLLEENKLQLNSECEKEIEELAVQIRQKYVAKLRDTEAPILAKKNEIELKQNTIFMHKRLAEAARSKCLDFKPSGNFGGQPGAPSGFSQHMPSMQSSSSSGQPLVATPASASQPTSTHLIVNPLQSAHRYHGFSSSQPAVVQQAVNPPVQSTYHSPASFPSFPSRPPQIASITPSISGGRVAGDIRAPAPHLQPFRPPASVSAPNGCNVSNLWVSANLPANSRPRPPQLLLPLPTQSPQSSPSAIAAAPHLAPVRISQSESRISEVEGGLRTGRHNPFARELLSNQRNRPGSYQGNQSPSLPETVSTNGAVNVTAAQVVNSVQCTTVSASASDVVCLSDDEN